MDYDEAVQIMERVQNWLPGYGQRAQFRQAKERIFEELEVARAKVTKLQSRNYPARAVRR
jgi:hypothetical protein